MLLDRPFASFKNNIIYIDRPNNHKTQLKVVCTIFCILKITSFHTSHNNFKTLPLPSKLQKKKWEERLSQILEPLFFRFSWIKCFHLDCIPILLKTSCFWTWNKLNFAKIKQKRFSVRIERFCQLLRIISKNSCISARFWCLKTDFIAILQSQLVCSVSGLRPARVMVDTLSRDNCTSNQLNTRKRKLDKKK